MKIFMDTNVYLSFYHYSNDDLEQLKKLIVLCSQDECTLYTTDQVIFEYQRNREKKIEDALKGLKNQKLDLQFPQICKDYPEYEEMRDSQKKYSQSKDALLGKIIEDVVSMNLKADKTIKQLFDSSKKITISDEIYEHSKKRTNLGNPPGKDNSLGDAVNWEALLATTTEGKELSFVSDDKDFASPLNPYRFNSFLEEEWKDKKKSKIFFFRSLTSFFKAYYPDISLASELEKEILIGKLSRSSTFATTHALINELSTVSGFTLAQINSIIETSIKNPQILWIINDEDVKSFLLGLISGNEKGLDQGHLDFLFESMAPTAEPEPDEIPF